MKKKTKINKKDKENESLKKKKKKVIKKKALTEEQKKEKAKKKKIEDLKDKLKIQLDNFSEKHKVYMPCYPFGKKNSSKGELKSAFLYQHIYICETICDHKCKEFIAKSYICREIGCTYYPMCSNEDVTGRNSFCRGRGLLKERKRLIKLYKKYFKYMAIYRGLKIDPDQTLKYLEHKKEKKNGKV